MRRWWPALVDQPARDGADRARDRGDGPGPRSPGTGRSPAWRYSSFGLLPRLDRADDLGRGAGLQARLDHPDGRLRVGGEELLLDTRATSYPGHQRATAGSARIAARTGTSSGSTGRRRTSVAGKRRRGRAGRREQVVAGVHGRIIARIRPAGGPRRLARHAAAPICTRPPARCGPPASAVDHVQRHLERPRRRRSATRGRSRRRWRGRPRPRRQRDEEVKRLRVERQPDVGRRRTRRRADVAVDDPPDHLVGVVDRERRAGAGRPGGSRSGAARRPGSGPDARSWRLPPSAAGAVPAIRPQASFGCSARAWATIASRIAAGSAAGRAARGAASDRPRAGSPPAAQPGSARCSSGDAASPAG